MTVRSWWRMPVRDALGLAYDAACRLMASAVTRVEDWAVPAEAVSFERASVIASPAAFDVDDAVIAAAVALVGQIQTRPNLWASNEDYALINAVRMLRPDLPLQWQRDPNESCLRAYLRHAPKVYTGKGGSRVICCSCGEDLRMTVDQVHIPEKSLTLHIGGVKVER